MTCTQLKDFVVIILYQSSAAFAPAAPREQLIVQNCTLFSQDEKQIKSKPLFCNPRQLNELTGFYLLQELFRILF